MRFEISLEDVTTVHTVHLLYKSPAPVGIRVPLIMLLRGHDVGTFYSHLTLHTVPGPRSLSYFVPFLLTFSILLVPPRILSHRQIRWLVIPIIYSIQAYAWARHQSFDVISTNMTLTTFMLLGWHDVRRDFRYIRWLEPCDHRHNASKSERAARATAPARSENEPDARYIVEPYPSSLAPRIRWVTILFSSMRLTNWRIGTASHDARQPFPIRSFTSFTLTTLWHTLFCYLLLDLTSSHVADLGGASPDSWVGRSIQALTLMTHFYAGLALYNGLIPHLLSIGIASIMPSLKYNAIVSPLMWPSHFGPLSSIYSTSQTPPVRNRGLGAFWGTFWHQNMRHITSTPGVALASTLGLDSPSRIRYMIIVASGFFWSGIVHMGVVPPEPLGTNLSSRDMRIRVASFFWLQIIGIGVEQLAGHTFGEKNLEVADKQIDQGVRTRSGKLAMFVERSFIFVWTASFLTLSAWLTVFPVGDEMGWWKLRLVPISIFGTYWNRHS